MNENHRRERQHCFFFWGGVEAALVDEGSRFSSSSGDQFGHHLIFRHYKLSDCPFRVLVPQRRRPLQAIDAQWIAKI